MGRHGRTQGGNQRQGNGGGAINLQQSANFRASLGIDVGTLFNIEEDDGVGPGFGNDASNARNGFGLGDCIILRLRIGTFH
jgi:hypothetical protein